MIRDTKAVLLVGGLGTRLQAVVPSTPKPLASVGNRPFLELLIRQLRRQEIFRLVLCTGHLADQIEHEFGDGGKLGVEIQYSREVHPLGTAGAVKFAQHHLQDSPDFFVMNGDSFLEIDFRELIHFHRQHHGLVSMAVLRVEDAGRYGTVRIEQDGRVRQFEEKTGMHAPGLVNAGVYVFSHAVLDLIPGTAASLERDVFPSSLGRGVYAMEQHGMFIDIGTPADYARAQMISDRIRDAAFDYE
jgi:NDP-sugar pyrophosphorylase family protein